MQKYQDVASIIGPPGLIPVVGVQVYVYNHGTSTQATIFSDNSSTVTGNPLTTDSSGRYSFYAADGRYDLTVSGAGIQTTTLTDIILQSNPSTSQLIGQLASVTSVSGASLIGIQDTSNAFTGTTVEVALSETITQAALASSSGSSLIGFIQSGGTAETVQSRLQWQVYITDYLSDADRASLRVGTTVNIDTALASAHTALPTNGGDILFPPGKYKITALPTFTKRVSLIGAGTSESASATGSTVIIKDAAMTTDLMQLSVACSSVENIEFEGEAGNTGDGLVIKAGRCSLRNVAAYSMGNDGIRIGTDAGVNANLWFLQNIKAKSNGRHGVHISDKTSPTAPDCNGGTFIHGDLQGNTSHGLSLDNAIANTFVGVNVQTNGDDGVHLTGLSHKNIFFGGDWDEGNTDKNLAIESGAQDNAIFWPSLTAAKTSDAGTRTMLLYRENVTTATVSELNDLDISNKVVLKDDFLGITLDADKWRGRVGSDPQCVTPTIVANSNRGVVRLTTGDDAAGTMAVNGVQMDSALNFRAVQGGLIFECRFSTSVITNLALFVGFTDQVSALEMPFTLGAGDALTSDATNAVGVLFDTAADTDNWWLVGVKADVDATKQDTLVAPVAGTSETWRIELTTGGAATFYRNGTVIGTSMSNAITASTSVTPVIALFRRTTSSSSVDVDYIYVQNTR